MISERAFSLFHIYLLKSFAYIISSSQKKIHHSDPFVVFNMFQLFSILKYYYSLKYNCYTYQSRRISHSIYYDGSQFWNSLLACTIQGDFHEKWFFFGWIMIETSWKSEERKCEKHNFCNTKFRKGRQKEMLPQWNHLSISIKQNLNQDELKMAIYSLCLLIQMYYKKINSLIYLLWVEYYLIGNWNL